MVFRPAEGLAISQTRVLVLGPRAVAQWVGVRFEQRGATVLLEGDADIRFPYPGEPNSVMQLRAELSRVMQKYGQPEQAFWIHPGASAWGERPELSQIGQSLGYSVLGSSSKVASLFGNLPQLLSEAEKLKIPHLALSFDPVHSRRELELLAFKNKLKYPYVLKHIRGGGRLGLYVLEDDEDLRLNFPIWVEKLRRYFGEVIFYAERYLEGARHLVLPFARGLKGEFRAFPLMDGSLQYRHRKLVEFCPARELEADVQTRMEQWTKALAESVGFVGVGSLEFLVDGDQAYLIAGCPRLDRSFALWESTAGVDALEVQLAALEGRPLPQPRTGDARTHGVLLRFYAEDEFHPLPRPGEILEVGEKTEWKLPGGSGVLSLSHVPGTSVEIDDDGFLGLLCVEARDRKGCIQLSRQILDEVWIAGEIETNEPFLKQVLEHSWVKEGMFHAGFLDEEFVPDVALPEGWPERMASVCASLAQEPSSHVWRVGTISVEPKPSHLKWKRKDLITVKGMPAVSGVITLGTGGECRVLAYPLRANEWWVRVGSWCKMVRRIEKGTLLSRKLFSQVNGRVNSLLYRPGDRILEHEPIAVLESLQTLVPHSAPIPLKLLRWAVTPGERVQVGQLLAEVERAP